MPTSSLPEIHASRTALQGVKRVLGWALVTSVTLVLFIAALGLTAPAQSVTRLVSLPPQVVALEGRLWRGRAVLRHGLSVEWRVLPGAFLTGRMVLALDLRGPETRATGEVFYGPWAKGAERLSGRIGPGVLHLIQADGLRCSMIAALNDVGLGQAGGGFWARGSVTLPAGTCSNRVAQDVAVPALRLTLDSVGATARAVIATQGAPDMSLGEATVLRVGQRNRLRLRVEPTGARMIPGLPSSAATELEYLLPDV